MKFQALLPQANTTSCYNSMTAKTSMMAVLNSHSNFDRIIIKLRLRKFEIDINIIVLRVFCHSLFGSSFHLLMP